MEVMPRGSRAAALVAGAGLVAAWLAAAADRQAAPPASAPERQPSSLARAEQLAEEIQSQAARLRERLAAAPQPAPSDRNPFSFHTTPSRLSRTREAEPRRDLPAVLEPAAESEPDPFTLSGIAEENTDAGKAAAPVRTAILSGFGDVFLARAGDTIVSRYEIVAVGADAVELKDLLTARTIRLSLR